MVNTEYQKSKDDEKINKKYKSLNDIAKKSSQEHGEQVKDLPKHAPTKGSGSYTSPFCTDMMNWSEMADVLSKIKSNIESLMEDVMEAPMDIGAEANDGDIENKVIEQLNTLFTPVLVMQSFETQINDQIKESFEQANVLTERNIIKFDDQTRMSQLISTAAILLNKERQTPEYKAYEQATMIKNKSKIEMTKKDYDEAKSIVQKYLVKVSTTNNSADARNAATDLLPETQH